MLPEDGVSYVYWVGGRGIAILRDGSVRYAVRARLEGDHVIRTGHLHTPDRGAVGMWIEAGGVVVLDDEAGG